jgi:hypothetical protein
MTATDRIAQVDPAETARLIADGALLLDVRELDEGPSTFPSASSTPPRCPATGSSSRSAGRATARTPPPVGSSPPASTCATSPAA